MMKPEVVLASASPRRRRLIGWLGLPVRAVATDVPEDIPPGCDPASLAIGLAADKARAANGTGSLVLAFDTIVVHDGEILGKPLDDADAWRMLRALSGGTHEVVTGVAIAGPAPERSAEFSVTTQVSMRVLTDGAIAAWIAEGEALGCAGAYNIERHLASVADDECFQNVAGLPLCHLYAALARDRDLRDALTPPVAACDAALGRRCALGPRVCEGAR
jgi:septum formation protein